MLRHDGTKTFPDWDKKAAEAEAAGLTTCKCGFEYYLTTDICPLCGERDGQ